MVYLYSEDKKGGFHLINLLNEIYFDNKFVVESLNGIYKLGQKIENIIRKMNKNDKAIIIYDDSPCNREVKNELEIAYEKIDESEVNNIYFVAIVCMEYEVLSTYGIRTFANKGMHSIIDDLMKYKGETNILKNHLKTDEMYKIYRDRVERKVLKSSASRLKKSNVSVPLTQQELNRKVTMDSICKEIMTDSFQNELIIDKADCLGKSWLERCCIKRNKICNIHDRALLENIIDGIDKQRFLMYFSRYHKVAVKISEISNTRFRKIKAEDIKRIINFTGTETELAKYNIEDIIDYIEAI